MPEEQRQRHPSGDGQYRAADHYLYAISGDNVLNADEKGQPLTIAVAVRGWRPAHRLPSHSTVILQRYHRRGGQLDVNRAGERLAALGQANYIVSASATSAAGTPPAARRIYWSTAACRVSPLHRGGRRYYQRRRSGGRSNHRGVVTRAAAGDTVTVTLGGNLTPPRYRAT